MLITVSALDVLARQQPMQNVESMDNYRFTIRKVAISTGSLRAFSLFAHIYSFERLLSDKGTLISIWILLL